MFSKLFSIYAKKNHFQFTSKWFKLFVDIRDQFVYRIQLYETILIMSMKEDEAQYIFTEPRKPNQSRS